METVFIVVDINLAVSEDVSIPCVFENILDAFKYSIESVERVNGRDIKIHGFSGIDGYTLTDARISNNRSMGSHLGVTYKSHYGSYPCARMIMERKLN